MVRNNEEKNLIVTTIGLKDNGEGRQIKWRGGVFKTQFEN